MAIAAPFNIDITNPGDNDIVSQHPALARTFRDTVESWLLIDHGVSGRHKIQHGSVSARDAIIDWEQGSFWSNTDTTPPQLMVQNNAASPFSWTAYTSGAAASGDVVGPASATDSRIALFDGTTGKLIKQASEGLLSTIGQSEAEAGSASTRRIWTAQRVGQAITALAPAVILADEGSAKFWLYSVVTGGVPAKTASHNVTSLVDDGVGLLTVNIGTNFSSANWCCVASCQETGVTGTSSRSIMIESQTAGTVSLRYKSGSSGSSEPAAWNIVGYGAQ